MKRKTFLRIAVAVFAAVFAFAISGFSQEDVNSVDDSGFDPRELMRPAAVFPHEAHNEKAEIEECNVCHHRYDENGQQLEGESSEDMECSECHLKEGDTDTLPLVRTYHLRCKGCHEESKAGPVMCGECHVK